MLHRICPSVVHGERGLRKPLRKSPSFDPACEKRLENLVECFTHSIISQADRRRLSIPVLMMIILIIQERLTGWSSWLASITVILFAPRREIRIGWSSLSSFMAQASFQMIDLLMHVSSILLLRNMAFTTRLASTSMGSMYTSLPVPLLFKITEVVLTLRRHRLCLVWT